jgi:hypothetical protein
MRETPTGSLHLRVVKAPGVAPSTPGVTTNCVFTDTRWTPATVDPGPGVQKPRPRITPRGGVFASTTTQVPFDSSAIRPIAPSLHRATNSKARNHDAENKKQNINQISGVLWHLAFFPLDDAGSGSGPAHQPVASRIGMSAS